MQLHTALRASDSELLCLPEESTFSALKAPPTSIDVFAGSPFRTHESHALPCDHGTRFSQSHPIATAGVDTVHCFILRAALAAELNEALSVWALEKECLADVALAEWSAEEEHMALDGHERMRAWLDEGRALHYNAGVSNTNVGGYQSQGDVFDQDRDEAEDELEADRLWGCRQLHRVVSAAMQELGPSMYPATGDTPPPRAGEHHGAVAWANVNRGKQFNTMHIHNIGLWSAVYFVADGQGGAPDGGVSDSGAPDGGGSCAGEEGGRADEEMKRHLIFRGGTQEPSARPESEEGVVRSGEAAAASHSYLAVPPTPGSLWLFPGSVPHCVIHGSDGLDVNDEDEEKLDEAARISIAINYTEATAPLPLPRDSVTCIC